MKILLTGGFGMVGRNLRENARFARHDIVAPSSKELDLTEGAAVRAFVSLTRPDLVIHAAGHVGGIQANMREPVAFLLRNMDMGLNVVRASREAGVKRLLNLGSSCMYPRSAPNPLREESILKGELEPTNEGYALAKITVARLCEFIGRETPEFKYKTFIPCNLYGRWDKFDPSHSHLVAAIIHKLHEAKAFGRREVDIWGDGLARREFLFAGDLAGMIAKAVDDFDRLPILMNAGVGVDRSINDYYEAAARTVSYEGRFTHDLSRPVGMAKKLVDVSRQTEWGWKPETSLEDGLAETYRFYLSQERNRVGV